MKLKEDLSKEAHSFKGENTKKARSLPHYVAGSMNEREQIWKMNSAVIQEPALKNNVSLLTLLIQGVPSHGYA